MQFSSMFYVSPLYACAYSGILVLRYTSAIIGGNDLCLTISPAPAGPRDTTGVCAMCSVIVVDVIILFPRQTCVYMLLSESL